ncbi:uncharacterized protein BKA78DRAFT_315730 [Phyllosticta capitalensis]|uniref:uncharacterized protein n=1 Tax=Phyllosticta capitalensis TaxID=121624 RepID=UPI00312E0068
MSGSAYWFCAPRPAAVTGVLRNHHQSQKSSRPVTRTKATISSSHFFVSKLRNTRTPPSPPQILTAATGNGSQKEEEKLISPTRAVCRLCLSTYPNEQAQALVEGFFRPSTNQTPHQSSSVCH